MDFALAILVMAAALAVLAYPLYRTRQQSAPLNLSTLDNLLARRDGLYTSLRDLELDRQLGKLDDADYNALRDKYMIQATEVLEELDTVQGKGAAATANAALEQEVSARRQVRDRKNSRADAKTAAGFCRNCGQSYETGDKFCAKCGQAL